MDHRSTYFQDTLFSQNPLESRAVKFLWVPFLFYHRTQKYVLAYSMLKPLQSLQSRENWMDCDFCVQFVCQNYYVYQNMWSMEEGKNIACERNITNPHESYTVVVLSICACCLDVSRPYDPVFALASYFLTDKTSNFSCCNMGGSTLVESGRWGQEGVCRQT